MARQPDVQYIQMYNYGSTAQKLAPRPRYRKEKYQLPEQHSQPRQAKQKLLDPLSVCAIVVASVMLVAMLIGMFRIGALTSTRQELEEHIGVLQEERADLQKAYEGAYDLEQVEQRARQMGLVYPNEVYHVQMGAVEVETPREPSFGERLSAFFSELFAKAPK